MIPARKSTFPLRLLIVDEHALFRDTLAAMFCRRGGVRARAAAAEEAVPRARRLKARVAVIGIGRPRCRAFELSAQLRTACPGVRLLLLDDRVREANLRAALAARAVGYWTKEAAFEEFAVAVRAVAAGEWSFCPAAEQLLRITEAGPRLKPSTNGTKLSTLTRRETEVFLLLAKGLSMKQCAGQLGRSPNTIDNHKTRLMKKLGVHKIVELVHLAAREDLLDE